MNNSFPTFRTGQENLKDYGYEGTHDYGSASFGHISESNDKLRKILVWGTCRDVFQKTPNETLLKGFCFSHRRGQQTGSSYNATTFLAKIEDKLGIHKSIYRLTTHDNITWVDPSKWWFSSWIRKSFYSMMIRSAFHYNSYNDNFEEALHAHLFTSKTPTAVKKFLNGYTHYEYTPINECDGWWQQFCESNMTLTYGHSYKERTENIAKMKPGHELISKRAYELWLKNGQRNGYDWEDYHNAEKELILEAA
jgi:hypothetical protein